MIGIYIHDTKQTPFAIAIINGYKAIETRSRNCFKSLFKDADAVTVAIIQTRSGRRPVILGLVELHKGVYIPADRFQAFYNLHLVPPGSRYDCKGGGKWAYPVGSVCELPRPVELPKEKINHGRSFCEFNLELPTAEWKKFNFPNLAELVTA